MYGLQEEALGAIETDTNIFDEICELSRSPEARQTDMKHYYDAVVCNLNTHLFAKGLTTTLGIGNINERNNEVIRKLPPPYVHYLNSNYHEHPNVTLTFLCAIGDNLTLMAQASRTPQLQPKNCKLILSSFVDVAKL